MAGRTQTTTPFAARFQRYECKYLITEEQAAGIRNYILPYVKVDPYASQNPDRSYDIASLYLDAPDLKLFRETQEGIKNRLKLRIRTYGSNPRLPVFLEIKRRRNGLVLKGRARIGREAMQTLLRGGAPDTSGLVGEEKACYDEFMGWVARWLAQPVVWVKYRREAYMGVMHSDIRVTMDRRLVLAPSNGAHGSLEGTAWQPIEDRFIVLECKFNVAYPLWLKGLVQQFNLKQISFSKYGNAVLRKMNARRILRPWDTSIDEQRLGEHA